MISSLVRKLFHHVGLNSVIARNSIFLLAAEIIRVAVNFIVSVVLGRYLEPDRFGMFRFIVNYAVIFAILTDAGISRVSVRRIARMSQEAHGYLLSVLRKARFALSFVAFFTLCTSLFFLPAERVTPDTRWLMAAYMLSQIFQAFRKDPEVVWQARQKLHYHALLAMINRIAILVAVLWAVHAQTSLRGIIICYVAVDAVDFILANALLFRQMGPLRHKVSFGDVRRLLHEAVPFALQYTAQHFRYYLDAVLLKFLAPALHADKAIGLYNSATPFVLTLQFIPTSLGGAIYPELARCYANDIQRFCRLTRTFLAILYTIGSGFACVLFHSRHFILAHTFGSRFLEAADILAIFAWFLPFFFFSAALLVVSAAADFQKILSAVNWAGTFFKLMLSFYLIPKLDARGLAWASLCAESLAVLFLLYAFAQHVHGAIPWRSFGLVTGLQAIGFTVAKMAQPIEILFWGILAAQSSASIFGAYLMFRRRHRS